jgi:hypothetical protein
MVWNSTVTSAPPSTLNIWHFTGRTRYEVEGFKKWMAAFIFMVQKGSKLLNQSDYLQEWRICRVDYKYYYYCNY